MENQVILENIKKILREKYPGRIDRVILFGSQTGGKARPDSDYDILVVLKDDFDWVLEDGILAACYEIDLEFAIVTDVKVISASDLRTIKGKQPFIAAALSRGIRA